MYDNTDLAILADDEIDPQVRIMADALNGAQARLAAAEARADTAAEGVERLIAFTHSYAGGQAAALLRTTVGADVLATATGRLLLDLDLDPETNPWEECVGVDAVPGLLAQRGLGAVQVAAEPSDLPRAEIDLYWNWHQVAMRLPVGR